MDWITEHWSIITTVAAAIVALLKYLGQAKYGRIIEAMVYQIEKLDPAEMRILKKRIRSATFQDNTHETLHKIVKKVT